MQKLLKSGSGRIIIDLEGLEYISSAGLRGILTMGKACKSAGTALAFCSMQNMVADMFKLPASLPFSRCIPPSTKP